MSQEIGKYYKWQCDSSVNASGTDKLDLDNEGSKSRTFSIL